jgi:hypothetical protein
VRTMAAPPPALVRGAHLRCAVRNVLSSIVRMQCTADRRIYGADGVLVGTMSIVEAHRRDSERRGTVLQPDLQKIEQ